MKFEAYSVGLCAASICTSLPIEEAVATMNAKYPTGISSKWKLSDSPTFKTGEENGCQCPDHTENKHYLLNC